MRDNDSFDDSIDSAEAAAAIAAGASAYRGARAAGAGTLTVNIGANVRTLRFLAGETTRCAFASVTGGAGVFPLTLFR